MRARARLLAAAVGLAAHALGPEGSPRAARAAALDPRSAEGDVRQARADGIDAFCTRPERPLSRRARALCPLVTGTEGCQALADACADAPPAPEKDKPNDGPSLLSRLVGLLAGVAQIAIWALVVAAVVVIALPIAQAVRKRRRDGTLAEEPIPPLAVVPRAAEAEEPGGLTDAEVLLRRGEEQARRGELDRAAMTFLGAALRALDHRGAIRIARHRTNGEYVRACKEATARAALREIVREVERVQFGREPPSSEAVARVAGRAAALVRAVPHALIAVVVTIALGTGAAACQAPGGPLVRGSDPAGDDLLFELLKRQGMTVSRVAGSLAKLPMPTAGVPSPTVVIDVERVALEDDARAHLKAWVEAGGSLVLAGHPAQWPSFGAKTLPATSTELTFSTRSEDDDDEESDDGREDRDSKDARGFDHAWLARPAALEWDEAKWKVGRLEGGATYAAVESFGKGTVLGLANDDLFTNAALSHHGNPAAVVALLADVDRHHDFKIARPEDGISPPQNPFTALSRAGLGLGMWHALVAVLIAFLAVGVRLARPRPTPPPRRRAFTEHVVATGALYARARTAQHALAAYARFADERLRTKMPRAMTDPAAFLASRAGRDPAACADLWARATAARAGASEGRPPRGDELVTLRELSQLFTAATRSD